MHVEQVMHVTVAALSETKPDMNGCMHQLYASILFSTNSVFWWRD
jgi:hypothetical protein